MGNVQAGQNEGLGGVRGMKESQGVTPPRGRRAQLHGKPGGLLGGSHISDEA